MPPVPHMLMMSLLHSPKELLTKLGIAIHGPRNLFLSPPIRIGASGPNPFCARNYFALFIAYFQKYLAWLRASTAD